MGRKNKTYFKDLHQQAYDKLVSMQAFGESKRAAAAAGKDKEKIFSFNTYQTYWKHTKYFLQYMKENHSECTTLKSARKYVNEWLQVRADQGLSAWTVQVEAKALGKLYGISPGDEGYFTPPKRRREDITRSRGDRVRDKHFSEANNDELIKFCKGTGLRRSELAALRGGDLMARAQIDQELAQLEKVPAEQLTPQEVRRVEVLRDTKLFREEYFVYVRNGKGGRERLSPIIGKNAGQIVERIQSTGFVVLSSSTRLYQCGAGSRREHIWAWETVIQTPYEVDLPAEQVHELLQTDLPQIVAVKLGLSEMDEDSSRNSEENFMLEYRLRANFRSEYWEMSLIHTGPLGTVPAEMRNPLKQKKKRQAEG